MDIGDQNAGQDFTPVSRRYVWVIMVRSLIFAIPLLIGAGVLEYKLVAEDWISSGTILVPMGFFMVLFAFLRPFRVQMRIGYRMNADNIRIERGNLWRVDTIMPFSRVQHIDIFEGSLERLFGLSTLVMHSAGSHNSTVHLPGLPRADAEAMREHIRAEIRQDSM